MRGRSGSGCGSAEARDPREGAALIVSIWVILIMSLLISSMAFDMHVEANVAAYQRKRVKAQHLARAGMEWALASIRRNVSSAWDPCDPPLEPGQDQGLVLASIKIANGDGVNHIMKLGDGQFIVDILPEDSRRNVNMLNEDDWKEILDQAGVENTRWPELIDCLADWIDDNDEHRLHGAEKDDPYYRERDYEVKNAPLDVVSELLLVKGFDENLLYGGTSPENDKVVYKPIADKLTTWSDGRINVNTASRDVLMTLPEIEEHVIDKILEYRNGPDGEPGTCDDGFVDVDDVITKTGLDPQLRGQITTQKGKYLRVISIGEVEGVRNGVWAVLQAGGGKVLPVYWREEAMP